MNGDPSLPSTAPSPPLWRPVLLAGLAGGLGWGIRGQYGHETGAMIAGLLVSLVLVRLLAPAWPLAAAVRAVAFGTLAMGFGGSMTYGQTIGLTQDADLVGNGAALRWGLLGLALKGGLWIGFAGAFLGLGLGRSRHRATDLFWLVMALLALCEFGEWLLNAPFHPQLRLLPRFYFSADWHWRPDLSPDQLKPRREVWGGLLVAFLGLLAYARGARKDSLAWRLGLWGFLGGALGFPLGQSLQAWHAWNRAAFQSGAWATLDPHINWWNMMETTFGTVMGATLGLGAWLHRKHVAPPDLAAPPAPLLRPWLEAIFLALHLVLLVGEQFTDSRLCSFLYDFGLSMAWIPIVLVAGGRAAPFLVILPITLLPIAIKTYQQVVVEQHALGPLPGGLLYVLLPLLFAGALALRAGRDARAGALAAPWLGRFLLFATWIYWGLNYAFFQFPWPWQPWTTRTPNGILFTLAALALTAFVLLSSRPHPPVTGPAQKKIDG